jgi:hypothetical protein
VTQDHAERLQLSLGLPLCGPRLKPPRLPLRTLRREVVLHGIQAPCT